MQTILGAGGAIGKNLALELMKYDKDIRLVSRKPSKVNASDELFPADLTDPEATMKALQGSSVAYLVAGLPYDIKVWREMWPVIMKNVISSCEKNGCKLVFFDNIYMYDPDSIGNMTEETPVNPGSKKGHVRKEIAEMLMNAVHDGRIEGLIARSADFYGPGIGQTSVLNETVIKPLANGKSANWLGSLKYKHSFTYTPDAGRDTALLGNTPSAFGEIWHLPTASDPPTGKQWIELIAKELGVKPRAQAAPRFVVSIMGWFSPIMKELSEMVYQYDRDYIFRSDKFEERFGVKPTPYSEGIKEVISADFGKRS